VLKTLKRNLALDVIFAGVALVAQAAVVYDQPHNGKDRLYQSSIIGTDYDELTWERFRVTNATPITEIHWRGGYIHGGLYSGHATNWTIEIHRDIANFAPAVIPRLDICLASATAVLSRPTNSLILTRERYTDFNPTIWIAATNLVNAAGTNNEVSISPVTATCSADPIIPVSKRPRAIATL